MTKYTMHQFMLVLGFIVAFMASPINASRCPLPLCAECVPQHIREAPGVGFELAASYGTVALHMFGNQASSMDIFAPASEVYIETMARLSKSTAPPHDSWLERKKRSLNKYLGRPATVDVGTIAELLVGLKRATEAYLQIRLDKVVVSVPQFPALTREDLHDAIEFAGLSSWTDLPMPYPQMLNSPNAAYAANGRGLCSQMDDIYRCMDEVMDGTIAQERLFAVSFTNNMLHTSITPIDYAFKYTPDVHLAAPTLGFGQAPTEAPTSRYWADVSAHLAELPRAAALRGRPITAVVLLGEHGDMPELADALRDALAGLNIAQPSPSQEHDKSEAAASAANPVARIVGVTEPLYAAARGAALYARVRQEVPWDCREPERCKDEREHSPLKFATPEQKILARFDDLQ